MSKKIKSNPQSVYIKKDITIKKEVILKNENLRLENSSNNEDNQKLKTERLSVFITAESILVATLVIWAQYWEDTYERYIHYCPPDHVWHVGFLISIIFISVLMSIISIILALFCFNKTPNQKLPRFFISLAATSTVCLLSVVGLSLFGLCSNLGNDKAWHPSQIVDSIYPFCSWIQIGLYIIVVIFLIIYFICLSKKTLNNIFIN
jgi:hypothetical protein